MSLSRWAGRLSRVAVLTRHANAVVRGRVPERVVNYSLRRLLNRALRRASL